MLLFVTRFDKVNKKVQSTLIDLSTVIKLYDSLKQYVDNLRDDFESIENEAILLGGCTTYAYNKKRIKKRKVCYLNSESLIK